MYQERKTMTKKDRIFNQIVKYLKEKGDKIKHDFYLLRGDDCIGKVTCVGIDCNDIPVCEVDWWGVASVVPLCEISTRNLTTIRDYLRDGFVIQ